MNRTPPQFVILFSCNIPVVSMCFQSEYNTLSILISFFQKKINPSSVGQGLYVCCSYGTSFSRLLSQVCPIRAHTGARTNPFSACQYSSNVQSFKHSIPPTNIFPRSDVVWYRSNLTLSTFSKISFYRLSIDAFQELSEV